MVISQFDRPAPGRRPSPTILVMALVVVLLVGVGAAVATSGDDGPGGRVSNPVPDAAAVTDTGVAVAQPPPAPAGAPASPQAPVAARHPTDAIAPATVTTVVVNAGDSFWSIAERVVLTRDASATVADVTSYWVKLVEANQGGLTQAGRPDLIYAGQTFSLP